MRKVIEADYDSYYGNYVVITDSKGYTTKYAHMDSLTVSLGQSVKKSDTVGKSGNTGNGIGSRLHIECLYNGEYYNPLFYFEAGTQTIYVETPDEEQAMSYRRIPMTMQPYRHL